MKKGKKLIVSQSRLAVLIKLGLQKWAYAGQA